jgi:hypothetical protein
MRSTVPGGPKAPSAVENKMTRATATILLHIFVCIIFLLMEASQSDIFASGHAN